MAILQDLDNRHINDVTDDAVRRNVPALLTVRDGTGWKSLHSRLLAVRGGHLCMELPFGDGGNAIEFAPAEKVGVSFKLKHYKHIFTATVVGVQSLRLSLVGDVQVLCVCLPTHMQRLQRRAYVRADIPANRIVRATFWQGGCAVEPVGGQDERPIWLGRVANISAGGFQVQTESNAQEFLDVGDLVGVRLSFSAGGGDSVFCDAQFRHLEEHNGQAFMGFQFIGLDQTDEGRSTLQRISSKVAEFHRIADELSPNPGPSDSEGDSEL